MYSNDLIIYIAGKITGEDPEQCRMKFLTAENKIRNLGAIPINPFKLGIPSSASYFDARPHCLKAIRQCNAIFLLEDYKKSPGALDEIRCAKRIGLEIFHEQKDGYKTLLDAIKLKVI